jgi:ABC-type multidrug transport system ATPase subunit
VSEALILARGLEKRFGAVRAIRGLDLEVRAGSTLAVIGPNGAGKSTLLRLLSGLTRPSAGVLRVGRGGGDRRSRRREVGLIAHSSFLYATLTARENLILAARLHGVANPAERADALLKEQELTQVAERKAGGFSRGMSQRLSIARGLVHDPEILLLDEPFSGLDPRATSRLAERLGERRTVQRTLVLATHDLARAAELADQILLLVRGESVALPARAGRDAAALERHYREAVG